MEKLNLTIEEILNKEFNIDFKGYSAKEVDGYLDMILNDYQIMQEYIEILEKKNETLEAEIKQQNEKMLEIEAKHKINDLSNTTSYSSVDLLKRVSRLEEEVFKKS
ncbi:MAG: DivIVA domain-containing protein [Erysipelotrichaceae bacterium]|nr:DivIVA domain-containing protein [Erysipelotrichaceae bacterium]